MSTGWLIPALALAAFAGYRVGYAAGRQRGWTEGCWRTWRDGEKGRQ